ncbi:uncharacterized protein MKZ38_005942 [Zalerion maritima]|uniref:KOW domain-containing protein n=1 Tax=Zalerion maritima TaxID=339359 RepID=A0AAD5RXQ5_9PEZI|nr:uncharacterized protein MKZ38_005942 [Zalerion maritima]
MQRIARLTKMAERKAMRVKKKADEQAAREERTKRMFGQGKAVTAYRRSKIQARVRQREDWELGPLAPKRDVVPNYYGMPADRIVHYKLFDHELDARSAWCGGRHTMCLAVGDRVVVMEGQSKGKIGTIGAIDRTRMEVSLGDLTKVNIRAPDPWLLTFRDRPVASGDASIPISWVRLVHPLPDPVTGIVKDTVIHQLVASGVAKDRPTRVSSWTRVVPRLNIAIPWPTQKEQEKPTHKDDTVRIDLERTTFVPTLLRPPMPPTVINEMRNYYSRYRTRHEDEWVAKKEKADEDHKARSRHQELSMRTPLQSMHLLKRLKRKLVGPPRLSEDVLERIGQVIAKNRPQKVQQLANKQSPAEKSSK